MIVASQLVLLCIWWGAASSKLNRHFPFVVSVMISQHAVEPVAEGEGASSTRTIPRTCALVARGVRGPHAAR